jgi:hypothetical protein
VELRDDRIDNKVCLLYRYSMEENASSPPGSSPSYTYSYLSRKYWTRRVAEIMKLSRRADFVQTDAASRMSGQFEFEDV